MTGRLAVHPVPGFGAEDVVVAAEGRHAGWAYTGVDDGSILLVSPDGRRIERVARTGGRPLGIELYGDRLLVCDAKVGLLLVDPATGSVETLTDSVAGRPMMFCNNAAVGADGDVWFSDTSLRFGIERWKDDLLQDTRSGRLLRRRTDGTVEVALEGLAFANGVVLTAGEDAVVVAETAARRLVRYGITGDRAGQHELFAADLPGYPDNISRGSDGLIWVALASPTDPVVTRLQRSPTWLAAQVTRIPEALQPKPKRTVRVQAYDDRARLVHDLDLDSSAFHMVTGVRERDGVLWLGSLHEPAVAAVRLG